MGTRRTAAAAALAALCLVGFTSGVANAEVIEGTSGEDRLRGTPGNDKLYGFGGDDEMDGRRGEDRLYGGAGNDFLSDSDLNAVDRYYGGPGRDSINTFKGDKAYGGPGADVINVGPTTNSTFIDCGSGKDRVYYLGDKPKTKNCESVKYAPAGRPQARIIKGTSGRDRLNGTPKADVIYGYGGNDDLDGRKGRDRLYGGGGYDFIALSGSDRAFGGPDDDLFNVSKANKATFINCGSGYDSVYYVGRKPRTQGCEIVQPQGAGRPGR